MILINTREVYEDYHLKLFPLSNDYQLNLF